MKKTFLLFLSGALLLASCDKNDVGPKQFDGESKQVFNGQVINWVKTLSGFPLELGITFDEAALNSLPTGPVATEKDFIINIAQKAKEITTIDHIELDWNPQGHPPTGIYDLPHFDFHYYMVSETEVEATTDSVKMEIDPPAAYLPVNYVPGPSIPKMGKHWLDVTSPELNGATFTQTFTYGSNDGKVTFYEPMITKDFLMNTVIFERAIPLPAKVTRTGNYPSKMTILKLNGKVSVILSGFVKRQAS